MSSSTSNTFYIININIRIVLEDCFQFFALFAIFTILKANGGPLTLYWKPSGFSLSFCSFAFFSIKFKFSLSDKERSCCILRDFKLSGASWSLCKREKNFLFLLMSWKQTLIGLFFFSAFFPSRKYSSPSSLTSMNLKS